MAALCSGHLPTKTFPISPRVALGRKPIDQVDPSPVLLDAFEVLL